METGKTVGTIVLNIMDGREKFFPLAPDEAVVAAFESDTGGYPNKWFLDLSTHPNFREHLLGYSCGDWVAYKESGVQEAH